MSRGYFGIGIENGKTPSNIGTLWRSAYIWGAAFIFTINARYPKQCSDTIQAPRHIPLHHYENFADFYRHIPFDCQLVGVELVESGVSLPEFKHPERAIYLLGSEDHGLTRAALDHCHKVVQIPTVNPFCLNVAVAGSVVMYDRMLNRCAGTDAVVKAAAG